MAFLSRIRRLARSRAAKFVAGGAAVGLGAVSGAAAGPEGRSAPDAVRLGEGLNIEGRTVKTDADLSLLSDSMDSTAGSNDMDTAGTNTAGTDDTAGTDSPMTPDNPDSPDTPDTPDAADSPDNSGPSGDNDDDNSGPSDSSGSGDNSGSGGGEDGD